MDVGDLLESHVSSFQPQKVLQCYQMPERLLPEAHCYEHGAKSAARGAGKLRPDHHCEESWRELVCEGQ